MSNPPEQNLHELFALQMQRGDSEIELDRMTLCLAADVYPGISIEKYLAQLDEMASQMRSHPDYPLSSPQAELAITLGHYLFDELGFRGNRDDYYNPDNSFLNRVLETRTGIPISLSVLYIEIGRRLGLACYGVGLPGHFVVGVEEAGLYIDPFNGGELLSSSDCRRLVESMYGSRLTWQDAFLKPCSKRDILFRMLNNLKQIYLHQNDFINAVAAIRRQIRINPAEHSLHKELSWCHLRLNQYRLAIQDLKNYLELAENPADAAQARDQIQALWARLSHLN